MKTLRLQAIFSLIMLFVLSSCNRVNTQQLQEMNSKSIIDSAIHLIKQKTNQHKPVKPDNHPSLKNSSTGIIHTIHSLSYYYTKTWAKDSNLVVLEKNGKKVTFLGTNHLLLLFGDEQQNKYLAYLQKIQKHLKTCDSFIMESHSEKKMRDFQTKLIPGLWELEKIKNLYFEELSELTKQPSISLNSCNKTIKFLEKFLTLDHPTLKLLAHLQGTVKEIETIYQTGDLLLKETTDLERFIKCQQEIMQKLLKEKKDLLDENPKDLAQQLKEKGKLLNVSAVRLKKLQADWQKKQDQLIELTKHKSLSDLGFYRSLLKEIVTTFKSFTKKFIDTYCCLSGPINSDFYCSAISQIQSPTTTRLSSVDDRVYKMAKQQGLINPEDTFLDFTTKEEATAYILHFNIAETLLSEATRRTLKPVEVSKEHKTKSEYLSENILKLAKYYSEEECTFIKDDRVIGRNLKWVKIINKRLENKKLSHLFAAVGRGHLAHLISHFILLEGWKVVQQAKV